MAGTADHRLVRRLFLRALGLIYLIAFVSLWMQIHGLIGARGILPAADLMHAAAQFFDGHQIGIDRYRVLPTFAWISSSDAALTIQCAAGTAAAVLIIAGILPGPCLALLWALYLSLSVVGQDFLGFQWDALLLEAGALAIAFAPWERRVRPRGESPPSPIALWLLRLLGFTLMFESGAVKLLSGDPMWRSLTALTVHYQTQPLPTWIGWYAHQLPGWCQTASCAVMFAIELGAPWLLFTGRRGRAIGAALVVSFQVLILLTGNYTFFNWLTIALYLLWLDDAMLVRLVPTSVRRWLTPATLPSGVFVLRRDLLAAFAAAIVVPASVAQFASSIGWEPALLTPARAVSEWAAPLRTIDSYGLFAVMTTSRLEIVVEGSDDQVTWKAYEFRDKPGDVMRRPRFVAPLQPRLDWQMWFAALGTAPANPWFTRFCSRLLQGSPEVVALLTVNPFPAAPPRFIRAELYDYRFTTIAERHATGAWWARRPVGEYLPISSLGR